VRRGGRKGKMLSLVLSHLRFPFIARKKRRKGGKKKKLPNLGRRHRGLPGRSCSPSGASMKRERGG